MMSHSTVPWGRQRWGGGAPCCGAPPDPHGARLLSPRGSAVSPQPWHFPLLPWEVSAPRGWEHPQLTTPMEVKAATVLMRVGTMPNFPAWGSRACWPESPTLLARVPDPPVTPRAPGPTRTLPYTRTSKRIPKALMRVRRSEPLGQR